MLILTYFCIQEASTRHDRGGAAGGRGAVIVALPKCMLLLFPTTVCTSCGPKSLISLARCSIVGRNAVASAALSKVEGDQSRTAYPSLT